MGKTVKTSKKYTALLKAYFATHLEYRAVPAFRAIIEVLSVGSAIVLWLAAYQEQRTVSDYSLPQMVAYYALIPLVGSLTYVHISSNLPKQIKDGRISSKLLKPYSIAAAQLIHSLSLLINKQIIKLPIFTIILIAIFKNFQIQFQLQHVILGFTACLIGFLLHCFIDLCISYGAFWLDDIWAFSHLKIFLQYSVSDNNAFYNALYYQFYLITAKYFAQYYLIYVNQCLY